MGRRIWSHLCLGNDFDGDFLAPNQTTENIATPKCHVLQQWQHKGNPELSEATVTIIDKRYQHSSTGTTTENKKLKISLDQQGHTFKVSVIFFLFSFGVCVWVGG